MHAKVTYTDDIFNIEGILLTSEPLWRHTTFGVGGPADYFAVPADEEDLSRLLAGARQANLPVFILGGGSNLLVADRGIRGLVVDMKEFSEYRMDDDGLLILGAGLEVSDAAWRAGIAGRSGLEFIFGMPGSVGGALWMNARCYGGEISRVFVWADVMDRSGSVRRLEMNESEWAYKVSPFQNRDDIILRAAFRVGRSDPAQLRRFMKEKRDDRQAKGHFRAPCAGSAFKNNRAFGEPSGVLIDRAGLKGFRVGGAAVSEWHGNIIINDRGATAREIRDLLAGVADKVEDDTGFRMETEVQTVGDWED